MPDRSLDQLVAERVMGWTLIDAKGEDWFDAIPAQAFPIFVRWPEGGTAIYESQHDIRSLEFRPSESIEAATRVEDRIAELNLENDYIAALWNVIGAKLSSTFWTADNVDAFWKCIHATPEQRCLAALKAVQEKKG